VGSWEVRKGVMRPSKPSPMFYRVWPRSDTPVEVFTDGLVVDRLHPVAPAVHR
jgi:hypothetical protein